MINNNIPCYIRKSINNKTIDELINTVTETRKHASKNKEQFVMIRSNTIKELVDLGVKDLPMLERRGHVRENVLTELEAKKLGYSIRNKHFHGLGIRTYLSIIMMIDKPVSIYQYIDDLDHYIIKTIVRINGVNLVVPIMIEQKGIYNNVDILYNKITTTFCPRVDYLNDLIKRGKIKEVFTRANVRASTS